MRQRLKTLLDEAIAAAIAAGELPPEAADTDFSIGTPPTPELGDFSSNAAMALAKVARRAPQQIAQILVAHLPSDRHVDSVEVAPPAFLNFHLSQAWFADTVAECLRLGEAYGRADWGAGKRVQVEFVSANPVGPIHIGNARGGPYGDVLASLLEATGHTVEREYYVNDGPENTQIGIFGASLQARYLQALGEDAELPEKGYQGEYVTELAARILAEHGDRHRDVPRDSEGAFIFFNLVRDHMIEVLREDCEAVGIRFDVWFSEQTLYETGAVSAAVARLAELGVTYERDGAVWLRSSEFGDDEDRVVVRQTGSPTYLASDVAYGMNKVLDRGFQRIFYVWGPDHAGYVARLKAALRAVGIPPDDVEIIIYQIVRILREGEPVKMSKRAGNAIWLSDIVEEVGRDAVRFFFLMRSVDAHLDFDLAIASRQTEENPVYYSQYAHARIRSICREGEARGLAGSSTENLHLLTHPAERELMRCISNYPEMITDATVRRAPHRLTHYSTDMARMFHQFYGVCRVLDAEAPELSSARLALCEAAAQVLGNLLGLLGVSAPERM